MHHHNPTVLLVAFALGFSCKPSEELSPPPPNPADQEIFVDFGTNGGAMHDPADACLFAGPAETVVLVEFLSTPKVVEVAATCGDSDPYRDSSYWLVDAKVLRTAYGEKLSEFSAIIYGDWSQSQGGSLHDAPAGRRELWSVRKGGEDWFVMARWAVETSSDSSEIDQSAAVLLPSPWTDISQELNSTRDAFATACTDRQDTLVDDNRLMDDASFDTWAHTPELDPCAQETLPDTDYAPTPGDD